MKAENSPFSDSTDELAQNEHENLPTNVTHLRILGFLGGFVLGLIFAIALFFFLLFLDQTYSQPSDPDFANPLGVILVVLGISATGSVMGAIFTPFFLSKLKK